MTGTEFRTIRTENGLTQSELGQFLGFDKAHVSNLEAGKRPITRVTEVAMTALRDGWRPEDYPFE